MIADALIAFVALEHLAFLTLEMFLWQGPIGRRVFGLTPEFARQSAVLAMNQGLYNGFLAAGLLWSLYLGPERGLPVARFFLSCVVAAGLFAAFSMRKPGVFLIQGVPALLALLALSR